MSHNPYARPSVNVVYAPLHGIAIRPEPLWNSGGFVAVGKPEEDSRWELTPNFCGSAHDLRFLDCQIKFTYIDMEAYNDTINFRTRANYEQYNGMRVKLDVFCGSGGFKLEEPPYFRYAWYPDFLPKRGMRWAHQFTGISKDIRWLTFIDQGWNAFVGSYPIEILDYFSDLKSLIRN